MDDARLPDMFYVSPEYATTTMANKDVTALLLRIGSWVSACGHLWDIKTKSVGPGVTNVWLERRVIGKRACGSCTALRASVEELEGLLRGARLACDVLFAARLDATVRVKELEVALADEKIAAKACSKAMSEAQEREDEARQSLALAEEGEQGHQIWKTITGNNAELRAQVESLTKERDELKALYEKMLAHKNRTWARNLELGKERDDLKAKLSTALESLRELLSYCERYLGPCICGGEMTTARAAIKELEDR